MSSGLQRSRHLAAVLAAAIVAASGFLWLALSEPAYESRATLVLRPGVEGPETATELLNSLLATGTVGTYEHYLSSSDRVRAATRDSVEISVRAIPDTRVISLRATGPRDDVAPALRSVLALRRQVDDDLGGLWRLEAIQTPQAPRRAGLPPGAIVAGVLLLSALAALSVLAVARRLDRRRAARARPLPAPAHDEPAERPTVRVLP